MPFSCPFLVASLSSSSTLVSRITIRNAAGAYTTCPFLSSISHQCSFSTFSPLKTNVSHCRRSISFPRGLSWFFVYACVAVIAVPEHRSFLFSVLPSSIVLDTCIHLLCPNVSRSLLSSLLLSILVHSCRRHFAPCFCSFVFCLQLAVRQSSPSYLPPYASDLPVTSFTKAAASVHPLHVNSNPSLLSPTHVFPHPELSCCIQLPQLPHTRCLLASNLLLLHRISRSRGSILRRELHGMVLAETHAGRGSCPTRLLALCAHKRHDKHCSTVHGCS